MKFTCSIYSINYSIFDGLVKLFNILKNGWTCRKILHHHSCGFFFILKPTFNSKRFLIYFLFYSKKKLLLLLLFPFIYSVYPRRQCIFIYIVANMNQTKIQKESNISAQCLTNKSQTSYFTELTKTKQKHQPK